MKWSKAKILEEQPWIDWMWNWFVATTWIGIAKKRWLKSRSFFLLLNYGGDETSKVSYFVVRQESYNCATYSNQKMVTSWKLFEKRQKSLI